MILAVFLTFWISCLTFWLGINSVNTGNFLEMALLVGYSRATEVCLDPAIMVQIILYYSLTSF